MNDAISINRQFLIMAREAAKLESGAVITGLSPKLLGRIARLSLDEIETLSGEIGVCLISLRLSEGEIERLMALHANKRAAYAVCVVATRRVAGGAETAPKEEA